MKQPTKKTLDDFRYGDLETREIRFTTTCSNIYCYLSNPFHFLSKKQFAKVNNMAGCRSEAVDIEKYLNTLGLGVFSIRQTGSNMGEYTTDYKLTWITAK